MSLIIFFDPLEQFDILNLITTFTFSQFLIFFFFNFIIIYYFFITSTINNTFSFLNFLNIQIFKFIENMQNSNITLTKQFFLLIFYFTFLIILCSNFFGLFPFYYTLTSSFLITFSIAFILFNIINIIVIYRIGFFQITNLFLPAGTPIQIGFLLVFIEFVSYFARLLSLSIRLFANMMAGHTLLKILIGFSFIMLFSNTAITFFAIIP
jgi:ATP synthase subunit 6